jgi:hypothetical protein
LPLPFRLSSVPYWVLTDSAGNSGA